MAFHLRASHPIGHELRRVVGREFRAAIQALASDTHDESAIYETRKSLKKLRSVVRLLRPTMGACVSAEDRRLHEVARRLSGLRDAEVAPETLAALTERCLGRLSVTTTRAVQRTLRKRIQRVEAHADATRTRALRELREARKSLRDCLTGIDGFSKVRPGATNGYRRARKAMKGLDEASSAAQFHRWRRRVKEHWYHVRLFEAVSRSASIRGRRLARLETYLGDAHNLAILRTILVRTPLARSDRRWRAEVLACIAKAQAALRRRALKLGGRLFKAKPRTFRNVLTHWWRWRRP
jgi:CHAD domain-containing protein